MTTPRKTEPGRRPDIEAELNKYGVDWKYVSAVQLDDIDLEASLNNQARFEALNDDTVATYADALARGDVFPAVVAWRPGKRANQKYVIIDGNHRAMGTQRAELPAVDIYEVARGTRPQVVAIMMHSLNAKHGRATSEAERVMGALYLINSGSTQEQAAAALNVPMNVLKKALLGAKADARAREAGANMQKWESLTAGTRSRLVTIQTDEGFADAVDLVHSAGLDAVQVQDLVAQLNQSRSGTRQRSAVRNLRAQYQDQIQENAGGTLSRGSSKKALTPKGRLNMFLGQVFSLTDDDQGLVESFAQTEREDTALRIRDAIGKLNKIALLLDPAGK
jgi:hypothetical protein